MDSTSFILNETLIFCLLAGPTPSHPQLSLQPAVTERVMSTHYHHTPQAERFYITSELQDPGASCLIFVTIPALGVILRKDLSHTGTSF